ncbi:winged helix-turn-helix domain-containing protein [Vibrio navarrensis]|uniref:winged helix-turn-helix domain-containing protein n=1 Tax=Vibrio navarrensis TaxID=29495 RepID=UPI00051D378E|nr:winged helix-turn-helix domain-containing protein [Vibrio navarrensis]KGK15031.1 transcriptional regulator [Vibrio navarrensis]
MTIQYKHSDIFIFEPETFRLVLESKELKLSHKESAVLQQLCESSMRVVDRRVMLSEIWGDRESSDISLNKTILQLRRKFESIGIDGAIDTVPRVGYILKLAIETQQGDSLSHREEMVEQSVDQSFDQEGEQSEESKPLVKPAAKKFVLTKAQIFWATSIVLLSCLLAFLTNKLGLLDKSSEPKEPDILIDKPHDQEQGRTLLYAESISESDHDKYMALSKYVKEEISYYAFASKEAVSFIHLSSSPSKMWQKTFLMDPNREISTQIKCIAKYINDYKAQPIKVKNLAGMSFVRLNFYRPCGVEDAFLGSLLIKNTVKEDKVSTWTQDFTFTDKSGEALFHLKRFSRGARIDKKSIVLDIKSFHVDHVNQESLQLNDDIYAIFNQFTQDKIFLKIIDKEHGIYASSIFGGILFHVDRF